MIKEAGVGPFFKKKNRNKEQKTIGSGCGLVGRAVASYTRVTYL